MGGRELGFEDFNELEVLAVGSIDANDKIPIYDNSTDKVKRIDVNSFAIASSVTELTNTVTELESTTDAQLLVLTNALAELESTTDAQLLVLTNNIGDLSVSGIVASGEVTSMLEELVNRIILLEST